MIDYKTLKKINPSWSNYDKTVAETMLHNFGEIYVSAMFNDPLDDLDDQLFIYAERHPAKESQVVNHE
jgi:hypothetical protein